MQFSQIQCTPRNRNRMNINELDTTTRNSSKGILVLVHSKSQRGPETSNYTQASVPHIKGEQKTHRSIPLTKIKMQRMQQCLSRLREQNTLLKSEIHNLKTDKYGTLNSQRLARSIQQNNRLKQELKVLKDTNQKLLIQNQFYQRNNTKLKQNLAELTFNAKSKLISSRFQNNWRDQFSIYPTFVNLRNNIQYAEMTPETSSLMFRNTKVKVLSHAQSTATLNKTQKRKQFEDNPNNHDSSSISKSKKFRFKVLSPKSSKGFLSSRNQTQVDQ